MLNLITGSSRGLGFFLAEGFKKKNREIILNSSNKNNLEKAAKKLNCLSIVADLTKYEDCLELMEKIGLKTQITNKKNNKGSVTFDYRDLDQLNHLIEIIKKYY